MKKLIFILLGILLLSTIKTNSQIVECFYTPTGTNASNWQYYDYIIPFEATIVAVYGGFRRPGYSKDEKDWSFEYCAGTTVYNSNGIMEPWHWNDKFNSLYDYWINVSSHNYKYIGMVRAAIPPDSSMGGGAIWDKLCFRLYSTGINEINTEHIKFYPIPSSGKFTIEYDLHDLIGFSLINMDGKIVYFEKIENYTGLFKRDISLDMLPSGNYLLSLDTETGSCRKKIIIR